MSCLIAGALGLVMASLPINAQATEAEDVRAVFQGLVHRQSEWEPPVVDGVALRPRG